MLLPFLPLGRNLGLQPLPWPYFVWLLAILGGYLALTQLMKGWYIRRFGSWL
jgi:Mg2+-importing ATPase